MTAHLSKRQKKRVYITGGFAHPELTSKIAEYLDVEVAADELRDHANSELYTRYGKSVRGKHVFIVQPHVGNGKHSVNDAIMQQVLMANAARASSAKKVTAVCPYLGCTV